MKEIRIELPHTTLAALSNANVHKPPLLALHGWLDNAGSFEMMLPFWQDYHVIAVDLPGHGLSAHRSLDASYHFVDWIYDISQLIESLQWSSLNIVGHSMGGMIGSVVAAVLPEKVSRLVLIDSIGLITTAQEDACEQLRKAIHSRAGIGQKAKAVHSSIESALNARVLAGDLQEKQARVLLKRGLESIGGGYSWRSDQRLRTHSAMRLSFEQATSFIRNIQCPVLMIEGINGAKMVKSNREVYQSYFANLRCVQMEGGHHCHMEHPQVAAQLVRDFIRG